MASERALRRVGALALLLFACTTGDDPLASPDVSQIPEPSLEVLGQHAIRLRWTAGSALRLRLERRVNLEGDFAEVSGDMPRSQASYIDDGLDPNTTYGYRLAAYDSYGKRAGTSTVVGGRTSPPPGIDLNITTTPTTQPEVDADGYELTVAGPGDTSRIAVDVASQLLLSPLEAGSYRLTLAGIAPQCAAVDSLARDVDISDEGTETLQHLTFSLVCRDPNRGQVTVTIATSGDLPDSNGFEVQLAGLADDTELPDSARAYFQSQPVGMNGGSAAFTALRPGSYELKIVDVAEHCTVEGPQNVSFPVAVLDDLHESFSIACTDPGAANRPFVLRPTWVPAAAATGTPVALDLALDLTARAGQDVAAYETETRVSTDVLRYDSTTAADVSNVVSNEAQPGLVLVSGFTTNTPGPSGVVKLARLWFTVVGPTDGTTATQTVHRNTVGSDGTLLDADIRVVEGSFTVGTGGGGGENQPPQARANGPYSGTVGTAVAFSATGSTDPDGTIATYAWTFGDGATGTGAAPSHTFATAGTYTTTLTVTDNLGLTASATAQVTITGSGGGGGGECGEGTASQPFVLCGQWLPTTAATGDPVELDLAVDLTSDPTQDLVAFESTVVTDAALVRFDSVRAGGITNLVSNGTTPGTVRVAGFVTGSGPTGRVTVARIFYTVLGSSGTVTTQTTFSNFVGTSGDILDARITKTEGTLTIGAGAGAGEGQGDGGGGTVGSGDGTTYEWSSSFGPVDGATGLVPLYLTLDLRSDPDLQLGRWQVTELRWDPAVLSYATTDFRGGSGIVGAADARAGRLILSGLPSGDGRGLVTVAVVSFAAYGAPGSSTTAAVTLGAAAGSRSGAPVDLLPRIVVRAGGFITP